jgi:hypothetical protein
LFWKKAWLKPAEGPGASETTRLAEEDVDLASLQIATRRASESGEARYRCQATEIVAATSALTAFDPRPYFEDLSTGNAPPGEFVREILRVYGKAIINKLTGFFRIGGPRRGCGAPADAAPRQATKLDLQPGEQAQVRSAAEIIATLNKSRKNRGLSFEPEMLRHCGKTYRVLARVAHVIDERSGKMINLANDCIMLEGVACSGRDNRQRAFCPRGPLFYWREAWLRRAGDGARGAAQ